MVAVAKCILKVHPYGCGNALIEGEGNVMGGLVHLCLVETLKLGPIDRNSSPNSGSTDQKLAGNDVKYSTKTS